MKLYFTGKRISSADEKMILLTAIGILTALQGGTIAIEEAEKALFSPYMVQKLMRWCCNQKIVDLVGEGCELEDIDSLIPEVYQEVIEEMKENALNILKEYETFDRFFWIE
ncbi:MAG: DUF3969 family protein [Ruminococcus flavefaciens]|nr:DUF3969 family protein [Ruminococcus flavefaciens]